MILEKQVDANTRSLLINPQKKDHITNEEFFTQKERCESLQATLCKKVEEANEMKIKIASLETRAALACSRERAKRKVKWEETGERRGGEAFNHFFK